MRVSYPNSVSWPPSVIKGPVKYPRETLSRQARHFIIRNSLPFSNRNWIDIVVIGAGTCRYIKQWHRLVQIKHHVRMPTIENLENILGDLLTNLKPITVVVVKYVFTP